MIDVIKQQFTPGMPVSQKLNVTREFLQILSLKIINEKKFFNQIAFVGGTALRILYDIKRFSEDLDFSLIRREVPNHPKRVKQVEGLPQYDFGKIHKELLRSFHLNGLPLEAKVRTQGNVHSLMMKFTGLLKELGLSELPSQKLSIQLEIDANPPAGWILANTIVNKHYMFNIVHYDLPSLYAGKLHACFYRKFTKGRDFYDFVWYLGKKVHPNLLLLNNAIKQTQGQDAGITKKNFKMYLLNKIRQIDFEHVKKDVERFLEDKSELSLFNLKMIQGTIETVY